MIIYQKLRATKKKFPFNNIILLQSQRMCTRKNFRKFTIRLDCSRSRMRSKIYPKIIFYITVSISFGSPSISFGLFRSPSVISFGWFPICFGGKIDAKFLFLRSTPSHKHKQTDTDRHRQRRPTTQLTTTIHTGRGHRHRQTAYRQHTDSTDSIQTAYRQQTDSKQTQTLQLCGCCLPC